MRALNILGCASLVLFLAGCGGSAGTATHAPAEAACQGAGCGRDNQAPAPLVCGGIDAVTCPQGYHCVDDPTDKCDAANGGADCPGMCVLGDALPSCNADGSCPDGFVCAADPTTCNDASGTACSATCRPKAAGDCTTDADCPQLKAACSVCADGTVSCPVSRCEAGQCSVDFRPCPQPPSGCANIKCAAGFHCVDAAMCDPSAGAPGCAAQCVPDDKPIACGGLAGQPCPPGFECVGDPADSCDPQNGGADCGGVCQPSNSGECTTDSDCPQVGAPCSVCADGTPVCPRSFCKGGECIVDFPTCGTPVNCGSDGCKPGYICVAAPNDMCDAANGATCAGVCVPDGKPRPCGGDAGDTCPPGYMCAVDPASGCSPDAAGVGCPSVCVPAPPPPPQCSSDGDCVQILGGCTPCPDGAYACPRAECRNGMCALSIDACAGPGFCGGIAGFACPPGSTCVDNPKDGCDPNAGGADCGGICVREEQPPGCGGIAGKACPDGFECVDDPRDQCDPANGGADCSGVCRPAPAPMCASDADCPAIGAPCRLCADGSAACPRSYCENGQCHADFQTCKGEPVPLGN